jgi:hypothetical protein
MTSEWTIAFLDGSFVPAKRGGEHVGLTRKGNGTKWMLVVDGNGLPLGFHLDSASRAEVRLAQQTLDTITVVRPRGRNKQRPQLLVADRGYDSRALRGRGIRMCIPPKRRPKRWKARRVRPVVARKDDYQGIRAPGGGSWRCNHQRSSCAATWDNSRRRAEAPHPAKE